jgi:hypothetical protein
MAHPAKSPTPRVSAAARLIGRARAAWTGLVELARGLRSSDLPTRRMSRLFFTSLLAALTVGTLAVTHARQERRERERLAAEAAERTRRIAELLDRRGDEARRRMTSFELGTFTLELKPSADGPPPGRRLSNVAEVELVAECDTAEACRRLEHASARVRDEVTDVFTAVEREELLSLAGKAQLKRMLVERLNAWLPEGKVRNVYISKLVVS